MMLQWTRLALVAATGLFSQLPGVAANTSARPVTTASIKSDPTTATATVVPASLISPEIRAKWEKVAWCETHSNWSREAFHDGGLGILESVWIAYGGREFAPAPHLATPDEQILIATRINANGFVPDQDGSCAAW